MKHSMDATGLACVYRRCPGSSSPIELRPLPGLPVIRDLVGGLEPVFTKQYRSIKPYLINNEPEPGNERLQSLKTGKIWESCTECILSCLLTQRPDRLSGGIRQICPAGRIAAGLSFYRRHARPSYQRATGQPGRSLRLFRCHSIMNCVDVCPKGLIRLGYRQDQGNAGQAHGMSDRNPAGTAGAACWNSTLFWRGLWSRISSGFYRRKWKPSRGCWLIPTRFMGAALQSNGNRC